MKALGTMEDQKTFKLGNVGFSFPGALCDQFPMHHLSLDDMVT